MTEAVEQLIAAPEAGETASPVEAPVSGETQPTNEPKTFSQEDVSAIVAKELAKKERKWQRERDQAIAEAVSKAQPKPQPEAQAKPSPESFKTTEDYVEAIAEWKADQRIAAALTNREKAATETQQRREADATVQAFTQKEDAARDKYSDYDDVVRDPTLPITDAMARTIQESESGPELAYFLGKNPGEAARIAKLSPFLQAKELGRIEAKLPTETPKKTSSAPEPITPVTARGSQPVFDTTDPRSTKQMSASEWINADNARIKKKLEAQGYR